MAHKARLFDIRMADGSRHFADVPMRIPPYALRERLEAAHGVRVTAFISTGTEAWIDFDYRGDSFTVHNPCGDYWIFVDDPSCPDEVLVEVTKLIS
jgi:hypothetical protein